MQFSTCAPPYLAVGHYQRLPKLPALRPGRFSLAAQRAEPLLPRTRVVKDVLRVGRWKCGVREGQPVFWDVTRQTLDDLASQFKLAQSRGVAHNLVSGHGDPQTGVVHPRDLLAPLDQVFVSGDVLWATAYVTPATARRLSNPACKVSVRVAEKWTDGAGRDYPLMLLHVAVVDEPVLDGQGPFHQLSLPVSVPVASGVHAMPEDFARLKTLIGQLLKPWNLALGAEVTSDTLLDELETLCQSLPEQPAAGDESTHAELANFPGLRQTVHQLSTQLGHLTSDIAALKSLSSSGGNEAAYQAHLNCLALAGNIDARMVTRLNQLGARHQWDLSLLEPFGHVHMVDMSRLAATLANNQPPAVPGQPQKKTPAEIAAGVKALGG